MKFKIIPPTKEEIDQKDKKSRFHKNEAINCELCNSVFKYGFKNSTICGLCKIIITCYNCNKDFEFVLAQTGLQYNKDREFRQKIINKDKSLNDLKIICPKCLKNNNPGYCSICGKYNKERDGSNRGRDIGYGIGIWYDENNEECGCQCSKNFYIKHNSSKEMKDISSKNAKKNFLPKQEEWKNGNTKCTKCKRINKELDQCGRGKDVIYGNGQTIKEDNLIKNIIKLKNKNIKPIYPKFHIIGCDCSYKDHVKISNDTLDYKTKPGICSNCKRDTREDNPPTNRTCSCLCNKCQAEIMNKINEQKRIDIENGSRKDWGGCMSSEWWIFESNIPCNKKCSELNGCDKNCLKNKWGWCKNILNFGFGNLQCSNIEIKFCEKCNRETPHKYNVEINEFYCQVCDGEKVWCEKHQQFETVNYNSDPSHGLFYKSITKNWIKNNNEEFENIYYIIDFKNNIDNSKPICGIYLWRIDNIPYYGGKSYDILSRSYDHIYEMQNDPEYWLNINDQEINRNHTISVEVLQECDRNISDDELHNIELEWIAKIKPMSQKCNGTDHIIPLNQRYYNIDNLKEKYNERINII